jgi:hypothetical protein
MSEMLERVTGASVDGAKPDWMDLRLLTSSLGEGAEFAFATCVLLGALWLLVSGYA